MHIEDSNGNPGIQPEITAGAGTVDFTLTSTGADGIALVSQETTSDDSDPTVPKLPVNLKEGAGGRASRTRRLKQKSISAKDKVAPADVTNKTEKTKGGWCGCLAIGTLAVGTAGLLAADALGWIDIGADLGLVSKPPIVFNGQPNEPIAPEPTDEYPTAEPPTPDPCYSVEVFRGDSFWKIAEEQLGNGFAYPTLQAQNPGVAGLSPGMHIRVCNNGDGGVIPVEPTAKPTEDPEDQYRPPRLSREALPGDIVPRHELAVKYKTHIHDAPGVNLHIRRGGIDDFSIFDALQRNDVRSLDIVLVDADDVKADSMTLEQRATLPDFYQQLLADDQTPPDPNEPNVHAVGKYWFNTDGRIYIIVATGGYLKPRRAQSYPSASEFGFTQMQDYPIGGITAAYIVRHELLHFTSGKAKDVHMNNETLTDYLALEGIRQAEIQKARGNDFLYSIVFETAEGTTVSQLPREELTDPDFVPGMRADRIKGHSTQAHRDRANARFYRGR